MVFMETQQFLEAEAPESLEMLRSHSFSFECGYGMGPGEAPSGSLGMLSWSRGPHSPQAHHASVG